MSHQIRYNFYDIPEIPKDWDNTKLNYVLSISDNKSSNFSTEKNLSLTNAGIIEKNIKTNQGQVAESYEKYILVKKGQICMNPMDLWTGWVDISPYDGLMSPAYYTFILNDEFDNKFVNYFIQSNYSRKTFFTLGKGVASHDNFGRWVLTLEELKKIIFYYPDIQEQRLCSSYLEEKTKIIELLIENIHKKVELIKEALRSHYYELEVKSSKIVHHPSLWFKFMPNDWKIIKFKELFEPITHVNNLSDERLLSVTQDKGVVFRDEQDTNVVNPSGDVSAYKLVIPGDIIISLRSADGGLETSDIRGLVSPAYQVLRSKTKIDRNFYRFLFTSDNFIIEINRYIKGIRDGKSIAFDDIKNIPIPFFPQSTSNHQYKLIKSKHQNLFTSFKKCNKKIKLLIEFKKSLISNVVNGKIRISEDMI